MKSLFTRFALPLTLTAMLVAGCSNDAPTSPETSGPPETSGALETSGPPNTMDSQDVHAHPTEGPHHGDLIELGNEEYHAELLHDEGAGTVTIYVLDSTAKEQVSIDATEVTINAKHNGKPEQFKLAASPDVNDPQGKSSRFVSNDKELARHLDEEGADPRLVLTINGKSYRGVITHDHEGHNH